MSFFATLFIMLIILAAAGGATSFRQPVHSALSAALAFAAIGLLFIAIGAEFVGIVQLLVYAGGVGILVVFVLMLAPPNVVDLPRHLKGLGAVLSALTALAVFVALAWVILASPSLADSVDPGTVEASVEGIGQQLLTTHLLPLQIAGVLLTAALIGAILTVSEKE
jgi:NADH-quinone oxidoreductase subunit J